MITRLTYDDGDFTYSLMAPHGTERERAQELAAAGMRNVTITTFDGTGKRRRPILIETCSLTGHPAGDGMLMVWSSVTP